MRNRLPFANQRSNNVVDSFQFLTIGMRLAACLGITLFGHRVRLVCHVVKPVAFTFSAPVADITNIRRLLKNRAGRIVVLVAKFSAIKVKTPNTFALAVKVAAKISFLTLICKPTVVPVWLRSFGGSPVQLDFVETAVTDMPIFFAISVKVNR